MTSRRTFLGLAAGASAVARSATTGWSASTPPPAPPTEPGRGGGGGRGLLARDQQAFTVNRAYVNLNNGGVCPHPASSKRR